MQGFMRIKMSILPPPIFIMRYLQIIWYIEVLFAFFQFEWAILYVLPESKNVLKHESISVGGAKTLHWSIRVVVMTFFINVGA